MQSIDVVVAHIHGHVIFHMLSRWGAFNIQSRIRLPKNRSMTAASQHALTAPIEDRNPFLSSSLRKRRLVYWEPRSEWNTTPLFSLLRLIAHINIFGWEMVRKPHKYWICLSVEVIWSLTASASPVLARGINGKSQHRCQPSESLLILLN